MTNSLSLLGRLTGPGELAAAVPALLGFVPQESLVVLALRGPSRRLGLVARIDLPPPDLVGEALEVLLQAARRDRATAVVAVLHTSAPGPWPQEALADRLCARAADLRLLVDDVVLVRDGCWTSYLCRDARCCPPGGTPLPQGSVPLRLLQAETVLAGRAVLPDRAALEADLAAPSGPVAARMSEALAEADRDLGAELVGRGRRETVQRLLAAFRSALAEHEQEPGRSPGDAEAAQLLLGLRDVQVRDAVLTWLPARGEALLGLLTALARLAPPPHDAAVSACLGAVAYSRGNGAVAGIALERALASDPEHGLALLLQDALRHVVPPDVVRQALVGPRRRPRRAAASRS